MLRNLWFCVALVCSVLTTSAIAQGQAGSQAPEQIVESLTLKDCQATLDQQGIEVARLKAALSTMQRITEQWKSRAIVAEAALAKTKAEEKPAAKPPVPQLPAAAPNPASKSETK